MYVCEQASRGVTDPLRDLLFHAPKHRSRSQPEVVAMTFAGTIMNINLSKSTPRLFSGIFLSRK
jgi:hypothetical protein